MMLSHDLKSNRLVCSNFHIFASSTRLDLWISGDLVGYLQRLTGSANISVVGSIPAASDVMKSEERQMKLCGILIS
jgi:hypothetical protein